IAAPAWRRRALRLRGLRRCRFRRRSSGNECRFAPAPLRLGGGKAEWFKPGLDDAAHPAFFRSLWRTPALRFGWSRPLARGAGVRLAGKVVLKSVLQPPQFEDQRRTLRPDILAMPFAGRMPLETFGILHMVLKSHGSALSTTGVLRISCTFGSFG